MVSLFCRIKTSQKSSCFLVLQKRPARHSGNPVLSTTPSSGREREREREREDYLTLAPLRTVKTESLKRPSTNSLFRRGSTFRFSGRTQFRLLQEGTQSKRRKSSRGFERSVKFSRDEVTAFIFSPPSLFRISSRNRFARKTM